MKLIKLPVQMFIGILIIGSVLSGCSLPSSGSPSAGAQLAENPPTPTSTPIPLGADTEESEITPALPTQGDLELHFIDPISQEECSAHFPFEISYGEETTIAGSGIIDCKITVQQCGDGACMNYHSSYDYQGTLTGVVQPGSASAPEGSLDAGLTGTLIMKQYWTDFPPDAIVIFTEDQPFEVSATDVIPLFFHFVEGATQEFGNASIPNAQPWIFTLHLD